MTVHFHTDNEQIIRSVNDFIMEWESDSSFFTSKTSGSTGTPKEIRIEKKFALASAKATCNYLDLKPGDKALVCLSPETIAGKMMLVRSILQQLELHVVEPSATPLENLEVPFDFIAMVPYQVSATLRKKPHAFSAKTKLIIGGGAISNELEETIINTEVNAFHTFGMTETISHVAMRSISNHEETFKALPGISFDLQENQLMIHAPNIGIESLITNDCVDLISNQEFRWLGRADFVINSGGIKIHPEEIENELQNHIDLPLFVVGIPHPDLGQQLVLCIEGEPFDLFKEDLRKFLTRFQIPGKVYFFDQFIRTTSGKINRIETLKGEKFNEKSLL